MAFPKFSDKPIRSTTRIGVRPIVCMYVYIYIYNYIYIYIYHPNFQWVWINTEYIKMDGLESTGAT